MKTAADRTAPLFDVGPSAPLGAPVTVQKKNPWKPMEAIGSWKRPGQEICFQNGKYHLYDCGQHAGEFSTMLLAALAADEC